MHAETEALVEVGRPEAPAQQSRKCGLRTSGKRLWSAPRGLPDRGLLDLTQPALEMTVTRDASSRSPL